MLDETHRIAYDEFIRESDVPAKSRKEVSTMKYECPCGYIYDPEVGDPEGGIEPGTAWEDIPDDWVCPVCGLGKDAFTEA